MCISDIVLFFEITLAKIQKHLSKSKILILFILPKYCCTEVLISYILNPLRFCFFFNRCCL